jgi:hypothetical protein
MRCNEFHDKLLDAPDAYHNSSPSGERHQLGWEMSNAVSLMFGS